MDRKIRLGPIAIFLAVIAVVLSTLAMLTQATAHADLVMAKRFASVTKIRYSLEEEGHRRLMEADDAIKKGTYSAESAGAMVMESGNISYVIKKGGYMLTIEITDPDKAPEGSDKAYDIVKWKINKEWSAEDPFNNIWKG